MLAYLSWHRPAIGVQQERYERALENFHRSLAHQRPNGFRGSATIRMPDLPWLTPIAEAEVGCGYEDWYLVDDWSAIGVLEEAAVSHGHLTAHNAAASLAGAATGAVYRLLEGQPSLTAPGAVWVTGKLAPGRSFLAEMLGDGMDPQQAGLWRRCVGLGPAPEYCLLTTEVPAGVAVDRLPKSWTTETLVREPIWSG